MMEIMRSDLQNIIALLPSLSADELDKLHRRIKALKGSAEPSSKKINGAADVDMVQDTICAVLNTHGIMWRRQFTRTEGQLDKIQLVIKFLESVAKDRVEQETLLTIAIDLLWQSMAQQHIPTTGNTLLRNLHLIPAIINQKFPGYAKAGALRAIVKRLGEWQVFRTVGKSIIENGKPAKRDQL